MIILKYKSSILFIIIGILSTVISFILLDNLYKSQDLWIKAEVNLTEVKEANPLTTNTDDKGYYGKYTFFINDMPIDLYSEKVSDPKYIENYLVFYINPNDYSDYHPEYNSHTKYLSFLGLGFCILGIIEFIISTKKA